MRMETHVRKFAKLSLAAALFATLFTACKKEDEPAPPAKPVATNIEIGTANNKRALIGRDFHFNADVIVSGKIAEVQFNIRQKASETYASQWQLELKWDEYKGVKNTNVHKHFTIPANAPVGKYDCFFIVLDENGAKLEIKEELIINDPATMPVDPKIGRDMISRGDSLIYYMDTWVEKELIFKKNDVLKAHAQISEIKGDGILYTVLIKKKLNYHPESIDQLDFSKVIVITKVEHKGLPASSKIATLKNINGVWGGEQITIGADKDGNEPSPNPVTGEKAWESGQYNLVILYKNTSFNMSVYKSLPITIDYK
ncbi:DUF4625 domain-containing protein [Chitinophaga arvensicola]|uniref:DUF4625 domain-containing protein n=1 Tax=Chitinophaga arvensicola TaxID=29529 RepID=A0A1I0RSC6_9BACT|nr:DUF4625 domain-containing protein [Chitinophaga arvensicola]SEW44185.1 protein of unknown function [Chitinophaga arvensicola]